MITGDYFDPDRYELMASLAWDRGKVLLLGNNSTHFYVAVRYDEDRNGRVELKRSFVYAEDWKTVYREALQFAVKWSLANV